MLVPFACFLCLQSCRCAICAVGNRLQASAQWQFPELFCLSVRERHNKLDSGGVMCAILHLTIQDCEAGLNAFLKQATDKSNKDRPQNRSEKPRSDLDILQDL